MPQGIGVGTRGVVGEQRGLWRSRPHLAGFQPSLKDSPEEENVRRMVWQRVSCEEGRDRTDRERGSVSPDARNSGEMCWENSKPGWVEGWSITGRMSMPWTS